METIKRKSEREVENRISKRNFPLHRFGEETAQRCEGRAVVHVATTKKGQILSSAKNASHLLDLPNVGEVCGDICKDQSLGKMQTS